MTTPCAQTLRTEQPKATREQREALRAQLEEWALPDWTDYIDDDLLAEKGSRRLRLVLATTGRYLSLLELAALRVQRGIPSPR
ncbi:hypothetical protein GCM10009616_18350 [Microlunatus lacustris]